MADDSANRVTSRRLDAEIVTGCVLGLLTRHVPLVDLEHHVEPHLRLDESGSDGELAFDCRSQSHMGYSLHVRFFGGEPDQIVMI